TGALLSKIILAEGIILSFSQQQPFNYHNLPFYIILGIVAGFVSLYYARTLEGTEKFFAARKNNRSKIILGGLALAVLLLFFPSLFGEGYESIKMLANNKPLEVANGSVIYQYLHNDFTILIFIG